MTIKRIAKWAIVNALFVAALWYGFAEGVAGARHVAVFWVWLSFIGSVCRLDPELAAMRRAEGPSVPMWLNTVVHGSVVAFLVWRGSWFLASLYLCVLAAARSLYGTARDGEVTP